MSSEVGSQQAAFGNLAPEQISEPRSVGELCECLRQAQHDHARMLIAGGGTRLAFGNSGGPFDRVLLTRRLNGVIHYEPDDMTLAVEPGCTIERITELLAEQGQFIALDVAHPERATIGGSYATGLSGPRRLSGGSLKDWVIGVEIAGVDGTIARAGGMVVKNVTGFDMMHLHYGALGAFGVVTRLNLKVFPQPGASRSVALSYADAKDAHAAAVAILGSQLQPSLILIANDDGWRVHVRIDAPATAIERLVERVIEMADSAAPSTDQSVAIGGETAVAPFVRSVDLTLGRVVARLPITASRQVGLLSKIADDTDIEVCADPGSALVYLVAASEPSLRNALSVTDAQPTWMSLPVASRDGVDVFGPLAAPSADVVRRLKESFDPDRQLNPGRFVLGL
ncbi:MAG: FAD-binding protein [Thermomicrobiales bacterium]